MPKAGNSTYSTNVLGKVGQSYKETLKIQIKIAKTDYKVIF